MLRQRNDARPAVSVAAWALRFAQRNSDGCFGVAGLRWFRRRLRLKEKATDHSAAIKDHIIVIISDPVMLLVGES